MSISLATDPEAIITTTNPVTFLSSSYPTVLVNTLATVVLSAEDLSTDMYTDSSNKSSGSLITRSFYSNLQEYTSSTTQTAVQSSSTKSVISTGAKSSTMHTNSVCASGTTIAVAATTTATANSAGNAIFGYNSGKFPVSCKFSSLMIALFLCPLVY